MKPFELIKGLMEAQGIEGSTQLAKAVGKPKLQPNLHRFLAGDTREPARSTAEPLAAYFEIPVDAVYDEIAATEIAKRVLPGQPRADLRPVTSESEPARDPGSVPLRDEVSAAQVLLTAFISTHPDRGALLSAFDGIVSGTRLRSPSGLDAAFEAALNRYRREIARPRG